MFQESRGLGPPSPLCLPLFLLDFIIRYFDFLLIGDIIYIPKYWWIKTVTSGKPAMALKVFFNLLEAEGQQNEKDAQTGSILKVVNFIT